ncbi:hypothetical protein D3C86_1497980 [compost metagenome]
MRATARVVWSSSALATLEAAATALAPQMLVPTATSRPSLRSTPKRRVSQKIPAIPSAIMATSRKRTLGPAWATTPKSSRAPIRTIPARSTVLAVNLVPGTATAGSPAVARHRMPMRRATVRAPTTLRPGKVASQ